MRNELVQYNLYTFLNIYSIALEYCDVEEEEIETLRQLDLEELEQIKRAFNIFKTKIDIFHSYSTRNPTTQGLPNI